MGGFGSGRPAQHVTCEASLKIDMADPAIRAALNPNISRTGLWTWSSHGRRIASIGYEWSSTEARLTLRYTCDGEPLNVVVRLASTAPHFGGRRWWFVCPFTRQWVRALYLPSGARHWASRHAYRLTYQSQRECHLGRSMIALLRRSDNWPKDPLAASALASEPDPFGMREEAKWHRREKSHERRNHVRRIRHQQHRTCASPSNRMA